MSHNQELSIENLSKLNSQRANTQLNARKALNNFYASYGGKSQRFFSPSSANPIEVITEFYNSVKSGDTIAEIYSHLHYAAIKLGYNFTALGIPDPQETELTIKMMGFAKNVYSFKYSTDESENILVKSFNDKTIKYANNISFSSGTGIERRRNSSFEKQDSQGAGSISAMDGSNSFQRIGNVGENQSIVIPLVHQNKSKGVFVAGASLRNSNHDEIINTLCTYATVLIVNKQLNEQLCSSKNIDGLTGLRNHKEFQECLRQTIKNAEKTGESVSVIIFDINNIARINREHGHLKGDEIISLIAEQTKKNIRTKDIAGRYGGDEIAIILPGADNTKACYVAKHINNSLSACCIEGIGHVKASIGVATYPECAKDQEKLLILAEQAMLISKHDGYKSGTAAVVSAQDMNFWNKIALDTLARVIAKRHSQWGVNFEDELVKRFLKSKKMPKIPLDVVSSLVGAIDAKDTYTRGHSQAVSDFAEALARSINLPEKTVQRIKLAALLHDVGKIGITEAVLRKPGSLTDHEWEIMKQHPVIGAKKVLEPIKSLKDLIPIVKYHHERVDGQGYPDRLKAEEIPLGAKIVAIADAFHALISHRPYRKSLTLDRSIEILRSGAGTQWDRELVNKFISIAPSLCTKS
ncbi:MAG: diguanylate cyclase [bacterium]